ncbi:PQQ-binding-like beta-propeller repeat protein [Streptomyces sp. B6B3]|uniref:outer membrane protein assembly factor BamB family protein n=1 Tax=Streptomyces sp. B6B3 TaxID=3153570 RepID=UPI00325E67D9
MLLRGTGRRQWIALVAGGLLLSACTSGDGGDADTASPEGSTESAPAGEEALWRAEPVPIVGGDVGHTRLWAPDGGPVVTISGTGVVGYDPLTGASLWELEPPTPAGTPCGASEVNGDGIGAVMYHRNDVGDEPHCSVLVVVDTRGGEVLWHEELAGPADTVVSEGTLVTVGESVISARPDDDAPLLRFALDGERLPPLETPEDDAASCDARTSWELTAEHVLAWTPCGEEDVMRVAAFGTDSGQLAWTTELEGRGRDSLTYLLPGEELAATIGLDHLLVFDSAGEVRAEIPGVASEGVVAGSVLVLPEGPTAAGTDGFVGYDLHSGEMLWREESGIGTWLFDGVSGQRTSFDRVYAEGDPLILNEGIAENSYAEVQQVASLDPSTGSPTWDVTLSSGDDADSRLTETEPLALATRDSVIYQLAVFSETTGNRLELSAHQVP